MLLFFEITGSIFNIFTHTPTLSPLAHNSAVQPMPTHSFDNDSERVNEAQSGGKADSDDEDEDGESGVAAVLQ